MDVGYPVLTIPESGQSGRFEILNEDRLFLAGAGGTVPALCEDPSAPNPRSNCDLFNALLPYRAWSIPDWVAVLGEGVR